MKNFTSTARKDVILNQITVAVFDGLIANINGIQREDKRGRGKATSK